MQGAHRSAPFFFSPGLSWLPIPQPFGTWVSSKKRATLPGSSFLIRCEGLEYLLPDAGLLSGKVPEIEDTCPAHFSVLVDLYLVNKG